MLLPAYDQGAGTGKTFMLPQIPYVCYNDSMDDAGSFHKRLSRLLGKQLVPFLEHGKGQIPDELNLLARRTSLNEYQR